MSVHITLYSKSQCSLCEKAKLELAALAGEFEFVVEEVDITSDPVLYERFRYVIPVIDIENGTALYGQITAAAILDALAHQPS